MLRRGKNLLGQRSKTSFFKGLSPFRRKNNNKKTVRRLAYNPILQQVKNKTLKTLSVRFNLDSALFKSPAPKVATVATAAMVAPYSASSYTSPVGVPSADPAAPSPHRARTFSASTQPCRAPCHSSSLCPSWRSDHHRVDSFSCPGRSWVATAVRRNTAPSN